MTLTSLTRLELPPTADFHCHLRQDEMMELCTPFVRRGGCDLAYIMPNTIPPIKTVSDALIYHENLSRLASNVTFLMTIFLHPGMTPEVVAEAAQSGIIYGVKLYPAGVTTNSQSGVLDIKQYNHIFAAMEEHDLVLNLHGEMMSSSPSGFADADGSRPVSVLNAEHAFIPQLLELHRAFPHLRIVLEHVSTQQGLEAVRQCGPTVAATITAHHLWMTVDDWCHDVFSYCKPVAKTAVDRVALVKAVAEGSGKFFFGSDSAPHPIQAKKGAGNTAAGCFTQGWTTSLVIGALEEGIAQGWIKEDQVTLGAIEGFLSGFGRAFYKIPRTSELEQSRIMLEKTGESIPEVVRSEDGGIEVVPFRRGSDILSVSWKIRTGEHDSTRFVGVRLTTCAE